MKTINLYKQLVRYLLIIFSCTLTMNLAQAQTCNATSVTSYLRINSGAWQQTNSANLTVGDDIQFGPHPTRGGSWSWAGCGTSGSAREQLVSPSASCTATATYTNSCGARTTRNISVTVAGSNCGATTITPYLRVGSGSWQQTANATISSGTSVQLGPQPVSGGAWSWSGCGTSGSSREQTTFPTATCTATATYTNSCGARSTRAFVLTVGGGGTVRSPFDITDAMGAGWNLGNSLDALGGETNWGNPRTTKAMIDTVRRAGFKTLRIPVSWDDYTSGSNNTIATTWLNRVEEVVNYGLANDMYVIINNHHHTSGWQYPTYANEAAARTRLNNLWRQVATRFRNYDNRLIFETMNEPRNADDWWGTQEHFNVINNLNASALDTIRSTGGNNSSRLVMIPTYAASTYDHQLNPMVVPNDGMVAVSVHAYFPFDFSMDTAGPTVFNNTAVVDDVFNRLHSRFISRGIPVIMGEWGSTHKNNLSERVKHAEYYVRAGKSVRIPTIVWDNHNFNANSNDVMGLLNRNNLTWQYPTIVEAIMRGAQ